VCAVLRRGVGASGRVSGLELLLLCSGGGAAYLITATLVGLRHPWELIRPQRQSSMETGTSH